MKKIIIALLITQLSGCAAWDAFFMAKYDNAEYSMVNNIRTISELSEEECKDHFLAEGVFNRLYDNAIQLRNFSQHIPRNEETFKISENLVDLTKQAKEHYSKNSKVSEIFCKMKLKQISRASETAQKVIGSKPR